MVSTPTSVGLTAGDEAVYWFSRTIDAVTTSRLYRYVNDGPVAVKSGVPELVNLTASHVSASGVILAFGDPEDRSLGSRLVIWPDETVIIDDSTVSNDTPVVTYSLNGINDDGVLLGNGFDAETRWYGIALLPGVMARALRLLLCGLRFSSHLNVRVL